MPPAEPRTPSPEPSADLSRPARLLLDELQRLRRYHPGGALTDAVLAEAIGAGVRDVIDLADELLRAGHIVVADCGERKGRFLLKRGDDLTPAIEYLHKLDHRARAIHGRYAHLRNALTAIGQLPLPLEQPRATTTQGTQR